MNRKQLFINSLLGFLFLCGSIYTAEEAREYEASQTLEEEIAQAPKPSDVEEKKIESFYDKKFWFKVPQEMLCIGGSVQCDARFFTSADNGDSTFLVRRARLYVTGVLHDLFGYIIMGAWDRQRTPFLAYAWVETLTPAYLRFRIGLFTEPFSLEALYSNLYLNFNERSLVIDNYLQQEDIGAMFFGKVLEGRFEYGLGIFNGRGSHLLDNNQSKEAVGRIVVMPFNKCPFEKLYLGVAGSSGKQDEDLTGRVFATHDGTIFWRWTDGTMVNARRARWGADIEWLYGPCGIRTEWLHVDWGDVKNGPTSRRFTGYGWYAEGSYLLTGEDKPRNAPVFPKHNFDLKGGYGAWEIAGRYEVFEASHAVLEAGLATGTNYVSGFTLGLNWYCNPLVVVKLDWESLNFRQSVLVNSHSIKRDSVISLRVQAEF